MRLLHSLATLTLLTLSIPAPGSFAAPSPFYWQVDTFNAENLNSHGPGNHALWCGQSFSQGAALGWASPPGYGNNWDTAIEWCHDVTDPSVATTVRFQCVLNVDFAVAKPDGLYMEYYSTANNSWMTFRDFVGVTNASFAPPGLIVDETFTVAPDDYALDPQCGFVLRLRLRVETDSGWSDEDGLWVSMGATQIDDIAISLNGGLASFADFEPTGSNGGWGEEPLCCESVIPNGTSSWGGLKGRFE